MRCCNSPSDWMRRSDLALTSFCAGVSTPSSSRTANLRRSSAIMRLRRSGDVLPRLGDAARGLAAAAGCVYSVSACSTGDAGRSGGGCDRCASTTAAPTKPPLLPGVDSRRRCMGACVGVASGPCRSASTCMLRRSTSPSARAEPAERRGARRADMGSRRRALNCCGASPSPAAKPAAPPPAGVGGTSRSS